MREIKFRGKLKEKGMSGWIEGSLVHITRTYKGEEDEQECDLYQIINNDGVGFFIDKETIVQYTGLHDKNGKEIYESDIVEVTRQCIWEKGIVVFIDGCFFIKVNETLLALYECEPNNYELKAIGNIYENPDLLKGADNIE